MCNSFCAHPMVDTHLFLKNNKIYLNENLYVCSNFKFKERYIYSKLNYTKLLYVRPNKI